MLREWLAQWGPLVAGTLIGAVAHFGRIIGNPRSPMPKIREVVGFIMQLGLITLVAAVVVEKIGVASGVMQMLTASVLTVATNEVINWLRGRAIGVANTLSPGSGLDMGDD